MNKDSKIYIAGHTGLIGSAILRLLGKQGFENITTRARSELDLTNQQAVEDFFASTKPEYVFLAAARVGGIHANSTYPAELIYENLAIQTNVIHAAWKHGVKKLLFIASACAYPKECPQPIKPEYLLAGPIEPTNEPFAVAKIAGIRMCQAYRQQHGADFIVAVPCTVYGPGDHFDANGHVTAALMARFHQAKLEGTKEVVVWGTGRPRREFIYVDGAADALVFLMQKYGGSEIVNVGVPADTSIADLANLVAEAVGYKGAIKFDTSRPDGMLQRRLDSAVIYGMGWKPRVNLAEGLAQTYTNYLSNRQ